MVADVQILHQVEHRLIRVCAVEHGRVLHVLPGPVRKPVGAGCASSNYPFAGGVVVDVAVGAVEVVAGGVGEVAKILKRAAVVSGQQQDSPALIEPEDVGEVQREDTASRRVTESAGTKFLSAPPRCVSRSAEPDCP